MKRNRVGIDLGTTYSSLGCLDANDKPIPIADANGDFATPSVVYFPEGGKSPIVGWRAIERGAERPERFVAHAKRYMGSSDVAWEIDGLVYTPVDISAIILRKLLRDAAQEIGDIHEAVITVPAHFNGLQRGLTIDAGKQAGLEKVSIVNEPVAAALAYVLAGYALGEEATVMLEYLEEESTILVYDLGGGTFDLSIVRFNKNQLRAIATSGEQQLGGIEWDQALVDMVAEPLSKLHPDLRKDPHGIRKLAGCAERAKRALSTVDQTTVSIAHNHWEEEFLLERLEFEERTSHLVERTRMLTEQLLKQCNLTWESLDALVPVGGPTRMPMIQRMLQGFADQRRRPDNFIRKISPDLSVAAGAALFAGIIHAAEEGPDSAAGKLGRILAGYRTQNVSARSLGILLRDEQGRLVNNVLIPRNTPLPYSRQVTVSTTIPNQPRASVKIIEGELNESDKVVCKCTIDGLPEILPQNSIFDVNVTYDADGLLQVVAIHRDTGRLATVSTLFSD